MLYLIYGTNTSLRHEAKEKLLKKYSSDDTVVVSKTASELSSALLEQVAGGGSLFNERIVLVLEYPFETTESGELLSTFFEMFASSSNIVIVIERELKKDIVKQFEKVDAEILVCDEVKKATQKEFNVFSLTDAFQDRDKKSLWLLYREAIETEHAPEEIIGILFWSVKNMLLLVDTKGSAGLSPFVAGKARKGLSKWDKNTLENASRELVRIVNEGHGGLIDIEEELERFVLKTV